MTTALTPAEMAIRYAAIGWQVIPVIGKRPVGNEWQSRCTSDQSAAARLFATCQHDGVGVQLGERSNLIDFDCDSDEAEQTLQRLFNGNVPKTPTFRSGRGMHRLFRWTDKLPRPDLIKIVVDGLEIRTGSGSKGAQTVFPPSSGREWIIDPDECEPAEIPAGVVERINAIYAESNRPKAIVPQGGFSAGSVSSDGALNVPRWLAKHGREIIGRTDGTDGVTRWHIECPGIDRHTTPNTFRDCCVTQDGGGKLGGSCFHSSCGMSSWPDLRDAIGALVYDDFDHEPIDTSGVDLSGLLNDGSVYAVTNCEQDVHGSVHTPNHIGSSVSGNSDPSVYGVYAPGEWPEPIPLAGDAVGSFPVDALPEGVREFLTQLAEYTQTPIDLAAGMWMAATAIINQKKYVVDCGWIEPLCLYVLALMEPGNRKSAVVASIAAPIRHFENEIRKQMAPFIRDARSTFEVRTKQRNRLMDDAAKAMLGTDRDAILHEIKQLDEEIAANPVPSEPTLLADDVTPEHMATLMTRNYGRLGVLTAEGDLFDILAGRYSGKPNIGIVLKAHSGDEVRIDRGNRQSELIKSPALSMGFCAQPEVLKGLLQQKQFRGRGLMGRILFQLPESLMGHRKTDPAPIDPFTSMNYRNVMTSMLDRKSAADGDGEFQPVSLTLSPAAVSLFRVFRVQTEEAYLELNSLSQIKDWGGKLPGAVARIAGIFHVTSHSPGDVPSVISEATMADAIRVGKYFTSHAQASFQVMGCDENKALAELITSTIKRHKMAKFTRRDIHQHVRRNVDKPDDLDGPLRLLADHCCIRELDQPKPTRNRRQLPSFETNPKLLTS